MLLLTGGFSSTISVRVSVSSLAMVIPCLNKMYKQEQAYVQ